MLPFNIFEKSTSYEKAYESISNFRSFLQGEQNSFIELDKSIIKEAIKIHKFPEDNDVLDLIITYSFKDIRHKPEASALKLAQAFNRLSKKDSNFDEKIKEIERAIEDKNEISEKKIDLINFINSILDKISYLEELDQKIYRLNSY